MTRDSSVRILVITNFYPPHGYGGYESLCASAVTHWRKQGALVRVLTSNLLRPGVTQPDDSADVVRALPVYSDDQVHWSHPPVWSRFTAERDTRRVLYDVLDEFEADVVSVWNHAALSFGVFEYVQRRDIPVVAVIGDRWLSFGPDADAWSRMFERRGLLGRTLGRVISSVTGLATNLPRELPITVLFASRHLAGHTREHSRFSFTETSIVPHGVDLDVFPVTARSDDGWSGRLLLVSRLDPRKGVDIAIKAMKDLPDATLHIIGSGEVGYRRHLEALTIELGVDDRVHFLGLLDRGDIRQHYLAADALVFPSQWDEPFGIVPLEAMACSTPVIGTGTGGSSEFLVDGETYVHFDPGDPGSLVRAVQSLAQDAEMRESLRCGGRAMATSLAARTTYDKLLEHHLAVANVRVPGNARGTDVRKR